MSSNVMIYLGTPSKRHYLFFFSLRVSVGNCPKRSDRVNLKTKFFIVKNKEILIRIGGMGSEPNFK